MYACVYLFVHLFIYIHTCVLRLPWPMLGHLGLILGPLGAILGSSWVFWGPSWALLGPSRGHLGVILGHPGRILGHLRPILGPSGAIWGPPRAIFGASRPLPAILLHLKLNLTASWATLGRFGAVSGHIFRIRGHLSELLLSCSCLVIPMSSTRY